MRIREFLKEFSTLPDRGNRILLPTEEVVEFFEGWDGMSHQQ